MAVGARRVELCFSRLSGGWGRTAKLAGLSEFKAFRRFTVLAPVWPAFREISFVGQGGSPFGWRMPRYLRQARRGMPRG